MNFDKRHDLRTDPARLRAVSQSGLIGSPPDARLDELCTLAAEALKVPASFVSIVGAESDYYKSCVGFPEDLASCRELRGDTFCHFTLAAGGVLAVEDARTHPVLSHVPTVKSLGVVAYLGVPICRDGHTIGAFCVIDSKPRHWTSDEVDTIIAIARVAAERLETASTDSEGVATFYDAVAPLVYALFLRTTRDEQKSCTLLERFMVEAWEEFGRRDWRSPAVQSQILAGARRLGVSNRDRSSNPPAAFVLNEQCAAALTETQRRLLSLAYFDGLTVTQIAAATNKAVEDVRRDLVTAVQVLRAANAQPRA